MTRFICVVLLLMAVYVDGWNNLSQMPPPMPGYQIHKIMGLWFSIYRKPSYVWPVTRDDTNLNPFLWPQGENVIGLRMRFGLTHCTQTFGNLLVLRPTPVKVHLNDGFGGWMTSLTIVVATDYQRFLIYWGCRRTSLIGNKCPDPYVVVLSRSPVPDKSTIGAINAVLMKLWGITVHHLRKILHTGMCYGVPKNV